MTLKPAFVGILALAAGCSATPDIQTKKSAKDADLLAFFHDWRTFEQPRIAEGAPDYSTAAMAAQYAALANYQRRLGSMDTTGWPTRQQVDYNIVRAEMNGLDFSHRVLRPWARNPAFYVYYFPSRSDQPAREVTVISGAIEMWMYKFPLSPESADSLAARLKVIPKLYKAARVNLDGNAKDLWNYGIADIKAQSRALDALSKRAAATNPAWIPQHSRHALPPTTSQHGSSSRPPPRPARLVLASTTTTGTSRTYSWCRTRGTKKKY